MKRTAAVALLLGAATVFAFAPFEWFPLPLLTLGLLFRLWRDAADARQVALLGFAWGLGLFGGGVSWVYVSLHDVGGMAAPLAVIATLAFCAVLAGYPALAGYLYGRLRSGTAWCDAALAGGLWTLVEWLRGWLFTGFPWLAIGYTQTPPSPLAGFAPVLGVYGVSLLLALAAALLAAYWRRRGAWMLLLALVTAGLALRHVQWTQAQGEPVTVSLLQGNIPQSLKWVPERLPQSIATYRRLTAAHPAQLTVLPETAMPMLFGAITDDVLADLTRHGDALVGSAITVANGGYGNGAVAVSPQRGIQVYTKVHLVPFGEFVPAGFAWVFGLVDIPMSGFTAGRPGQALLAVAGQQLAINICYEDLFGEDLLAALPAATLLVNMSNTAWFGDSLAQPQHLQIARLRALETGRPMLRATNTGMTAAIAPTGEVIAALPAFVEAALTVPIRGYRGMTPYAHMGNVPVVLLALAVCFGALGQRRRRRQR
jgi:apolipoprotein N-acyltransferase